MSALLFGEGERAGGRGASFIGRGLPAILMRSRCAVSMGQDVQGRKDDQREQSGRGQSADHDDGQRPLDFRADARGEDQRKQPQRGRQRRH